MNTTGWPLSGNFWEVQDWRKCPLLLSAAELRRRKIRKIPYIIRGFEVLRDTFRMTGIAKRSPLPGKPLRRGECSPLAGQGLEKDLSHCGKRHGCRVVGDVDGFGHKAVEGVFDAERVAFEVGKAELVTVFGDIDPVHFGSVHLARNTCKREGQYRAFLLDLDVLKLQNALKVPVDKLACKLVQCSGGSHVDHGVLLFLQGVKEAHLFSSPDCFMPVSRRQRVLFALLVALL